MGSGTANANRGAILSGTGERRSRQPPRLLAPSPLLSLLALLDQKVAALRDMAPSSDVTAAMRRVRDDLATAIHEAAQVELWISIEEAHNMTGKPLSTLTRLCRSRGAEMGAKKVGRSWTLHLPTFSQFISAS